ncbi:hypothetical protein G7Z17_g849 [Cylindrodendrum hubeiense]|uniref:Uncharacterized protein n=1 Tax=Cylindrodendrum hubeiense TaxID=595255 RepID=A0A9P5LKP6_9HYPO|nr:hypothetical protein G7Z17_g849 [Cylindrodendrum hubeiense]
MQENRMNQSSTGLLRMTDDDRPFSKDLEDLFSTLTVSLMPLSAHRVRFTKVDYTFLSEDAIRNLGSLKFSQSNRMPNPKDPSRIITTTTTTTFSMSKDMGRDERDSAGVKIASERRINGGLYHNTFTGKAGIDWLMENSTTIDWREAIEVAGLFVQHNLIEQVLRDQELSSLFSDSKLFQSSKGALYRLTPRGKALISSNSLSRSASQNKGEVASQHYSTKDSNTHRLDKILTEPTLRLLFRENLQEMHCEENLSFYLEVDEFIRSCKAATRDLQQSSDTASSDKAKELLALSYGIYNAYLAPGSPRELNIHHQLRRSLASRMTKASAEDNTITDVLHEVTSLFEDAQSAVFKLMTSDSVPKFLQNPKYGYQVANAGLHY